MPHQFDKRKPFNFKQFNVFDKRSAMKVGTDAVLLGSWVNCVKKENILDIGTGSGVIALMLAQRSQAVITGVDIHKGSVEDAVLNFRNSKWSSRLQVAHSSLQGYAEKCTDRFDLIVSNPPFFTNSLKSPEQLKNISKHNDYLPYAELITEIRKLLADKGSYCIIIPADDYENIIELSENAGFSLSKQLIVFPKPSKPASRVVLEFGISKPETIIRDEIFIRNNDDSYASDYKLLTGEFYLNF